MHTLRGKRSIFDDAMEAVEGGFIEPYRRLCGEEDGASIERAHFFGFTVSFAPDVVSLSRDPHEPDDSIACEGRVSEGSKGVFAEDGIGMHEPEDVGLAALSEAVADGGLSTKTCFFVLYQEDFIAFLADDRARHGEEALDFCVVFAEHA